MKMHSWKKGTRGEKINVKKKDLLKNKYSSKKKKRHFKYKCMWNEIEKKEYTSEKRKYAKGKTRIFKKKIWTERLAWKKMWNHGKMWPIEKIGYAIAQKDMYYKNDSSVGK